MKSLRRSMFDRAGVTLAALMLAGVAGCAQGAILRGRISGTQAIAEEAERNGARRCAPRELATALAQLDFASTELIEGDPNRASQHLDIADANARAARRLSPAEQCTGDGPPPPPPPPAPTEHDRDGDGIPDSADACPEVAEDLDGNQDTDGCPESDDVDGDGIDDAADLCVLVPEDADGYLDTDGCPEPDDDLDGIRDDLDRCPREPEDADGFADDDGCPETDNDGDTVPDGQDQCPDVAGPPSEGGCPGRVYQDVEVTSRGIIIHQQIFFEFNRSVIRRQSFPILDTIAQVLRDYPDIRIEVQGHTDSRGNDAFNMRLSQGRSEAVRTYLVQQGIDGSRLTAQGYGETQPIESNSTATGRALNRRVEFVRTDGR